VIIIILFDQAMSVELFVSYYGDSYGWGETHTAACSWTDLEIWDIKCGRAAPYLIVQYGDPIGCASEGSFRYK
jgi:hypothetical protein